MRGNPDSNQPDIIRALQRAGYLVEITTGVGKGFPDLLLGCPWGELVLNEVKNRGRYPSDGKLRPSQVEWHRQWQRFPVIVTTGVADTFEALEQRRKQWEARR